MTEGPCRHFDPLALRNVSYQDQIWKGVERLSGQIAAKRKDTQVKWSPDTLHYGIERGTLITAPSLFRGTIRVADNG